MEDIVLVEFQKVKNTKVYETVISQLKEKIFLGELGPGQPLPPERVLADMMGVSRASIREALKILEFMGLIKCKHGEGTFISTLNSEILVDKLNSVSATETDTLLLDLLELREIIEPKIIELAIKRGTKEELDNIEKSLNFEGVLDEESFYMIDAGFHLAIARASHNTYAISLMETMLDMIHETEKRTISLSRKRECIVQEHKDILKHIKSKDKERALIAIQNHLNNIRMFIENYI